MTIYHRLKVWAIKGWRLGKNAFKWTQPRTVNMIWLQPVDKRCDYCALPGLCVTLECEFEVVATICGDCLAKAQSVLQLPPGKASYRVVTDHRGVIM